MSEPKSIGTSEENPAVEYRDVVGFPDYRIGSDGTVWSCKRLGQWRRVAAFPNSNGYPHVGLQRDKKRHTCMCHTLVLTAFVGPCPEGMECAHDNGNRSDCRLSNLSWKTPLANSADKARHDTKGKFLNRQQVVEIVALLRDTSQMTVAIARRYGVSAQTVQKIRTGRTWKEITGGVVERPGNRRMPSGEDSPSSKVTANDVVAIRAAAIAGEPYQRIADRYGISQPVAYYIARGKTWKHVPGPFLTGNRKLGRPPASLHRS